MKITAHLGVLDEVELIEPAIDHLYRIGVDHIVVFDMGSRDGTLDLLEARCGERLELVRLSNDTPWDELARRTVDSVRATQADWVLFIDADEFWLPASGSIRDCLGLQSADVVSVDRYNVVLLADGPAIALPPLPSHYDRVFMYTARIPDFRAHMEANPDTPWISGVPVPKVIARIEFVDAIVMGGHDVLTPDGRPVRRVEANDVVIAHVPFSTSTRFHKRLGNIGEFLALNPDYLQGGQGWHWRRLDAIARAGEGEEEYSRQQIDEPAFELARREGRIRSAAELLPAARTPAGPRLPIRVDDLASARVLELARSASGGVFQIPFPGGGPVLEAVRIANVHYIPSALDVGQSIQVADGRFMPMEAVFDEFTVEFVKSRIGHMGVSEWRDFAESTYPGSVCILGNVFSRNFTHWHEELMKLVMLERARVDCAYVVSELPPFASELLEIVGIPAERILEVREPTRFKDAMFCTPVSYRNVADYPQVLWALREMLLAGDRRGAVGRGKRLWLDRGSQTRLGRKLVNEEEVYGLIEKYGFERLDMGALSVREQIAAAADMSVMSGLHGSQFVHSQLMPERSTVIECFSPLYLNPTYTEIYRVLRHRYSHISPTNTPIFPYPHGADVWIDCQQLDLALSALDDA